MFSYGYCYGNDKEVRGYNQSGLAKTAPQAQREIKRVLIKGGHAEEAIVFKESESKKGNFRAWVGEQALNYVYFKLPQTWSLVDLTGAGGNRSVMDSGELEEMQFAARKYSGVVGKFKREGDTIKVTEGVYLVRIH